MRTAVVPGLALANALLAYAACPFMDGGTSLSKREQGSGTSTPEGHFLDQFVVNDQDVYTTTDFGTPVNDRTSLKAGQRGPTLLEDFVYRTKLLRFDRERIPERVGEYPRASPHDDDGVETSTTVHARGAAAHGYFESYADWSNITAASFLGGSRKRTPVFLRFSTVAGSRGSPDLARDVHGFALRFYTDEGNYGESFVGKVYTMYAIV